jgi:hypothetical protein
MIRYAFSIRRTICGAKGFLKGPMSLLFHNFIFATVEDQLNLIGNGSRSQIATLNG